MTLEKQIDVSIDENEIGYIALHIGAAIERRKMVSDVPKRVMIVCASGVGSAQLIKYKLKSTFTDKIEVVGTTEYYKLGQLSLEGVDFLISSIPIHDELPIPVVHVNTILAENDFVKIDSFIKGTSTSVLKYLHEDLMFFDKKVNSKEEALQFLAQQLEKKEFVEGTFLDGVYEREKIAPTAYGNFVAIPHPITPKWDRTFVSFCTLEKPITWGGKPVQLVCLLNVKKGSTEDLEVLYSLLTRIVESHALVQDCLKCSTKEELMKVLLNIVEHSVK